MRNSGSSTAVLIVAAFMVTAWVVRAVEDGALG
jgi:hypothetical protein